MKVAIMQPYLFPYIGYWQLMNAADVFVVYDNIEFTKKSWIRRNRILMNGQDRLFTLPIEKDSDYKTVVERHLSQSYINECRKILNQIINAYKKAPYFNNVYSLIENIFMYEDNNLFRYIYNSIICINEYLGIDTKIIISSDVDIEHSLKNKHKVIAICKSLDAKTYINPIGGTELYSKNEFLDVGIDLYFIKSGDIYYNQYDNGFIPNLSIIDVMMFNSKEQIKKMLNDYSLI